MGRIVTAVLSLVLFCLSFMVPGVKLFESYNFSYSRQARSVRFRPLPILHGVMAADDDDAADDDNDAERMAGLDSKPIDKQETSSPFSPSSLFAPPQQLSTTTILVGSLALAAIWPLLLASLGNSGNNGMFFSYHNNPIADNLDVDAFLTVQGLLDDGGVTTASDAMNDDVASYGRSVSRMGATIVELPALTPAERLVGAVFGPPQPPTSTPPIPFAKP